MRGKGAVFIGAVFCLVVSLASGQEVTTPLSQSSAPVKRRIVTPRITVFDDAIKRQDPLRAHIGALRSSKLSERYEALRALGDASPFEPRVMPTLLSEAKRQGAHDDCTLYALSKHGSRARGMVPVLCKWLERLNVPEPPKDAKGRERRKRRNKKPQKPCVHVFNILAADADASAIAMPTLEQAVRNPLLKRQAAFALAQLGRFDLAEPIIAHVPNARYPSRQAGELRPYKSLGAEGRVAIRGLVRLAQHRHHQVSDAAVEVLQTILEKQESDLTTLLAPEQLQQLCLKLDLAKLARNTGPKTKAIVVPYAIERTKPDYPQETRLRAIRLLGIIRAPDAVHALMRCLRDPHTKIRRKSVLALGEIGPAAKDAAPLILLTINTFEDRPKSVAYERWDCRLALAAIGARDAARDAIFTAYRPEGPEFAWLARFRSRDLVKHGFAKELIAILEREMKSNGSNALIAAHAAFLIGHTTHTVCEIMLPKRSDVPYPWPCPWCGRRHGVLHWREWNADVPTPPETRRLMREALQSTNDVYRATAAHVLMQCDTIDAPVVRELLVQMEREVGNNAPINQDVLSRIGENIVKACARQDDVDDIIRVMFDALDRGDPQIRAAAEKALGAAGSRAVPHFLRELPKRNAMFQDFIFDFVLEHDPTALGRDTVTLQSRIAACRGQLGSDRFEIRWHALYRLGQLGIYAKAAIPDIVAAIEDEDWTVRAEAVRALGRMGGVDPLAKRALLRAANDTHETVRRMAAQTQQRSKATPEER